MTKWQWSVILALCRLVLGMDGKIEYTNRDKNEDCLILENAISRKHNDD